MVTKAEHGLSFKVINDRAGFVDSSLDIRSMINLYKETVDDQYSTDDIMNIMEMAVGEKFFIFLAKNGSAVGLMTAYPMVHGLDSAMGAMIHIGVVADVPRVQSQEIIGKAMSDLDTWAKEIGATALFAKTQRNERPFDRLMTNHGWEKVTTLYSKEIEYGRIEQSSKESGRGDSDGGTERSLPSK